MSRLEEAGYGERYEDVLARLSRRCADLRRSLCAFWPVRGGAWRDRGLMVVGRAVNGWGEGELSFEAADMERPEERRELVARARGYSERRGLGWVAEREGSGGPYDTARSPFWTTARGLLGATGGVPGSGPWSAALAWTNLFKVAPMAGGNPTGPLREEQAEPGAALLDAEVRGWRPSAVVCLSGWGFSRPVLERLDVAWTGAPAGSLIERTGTGENVTWVVTPHPQRRSPERLVEAVMGALGEGGDEPPGRP